ncbi:hypothetical protein COCSADRAFT_348244 [Bipolaris sorokiniana ND90Pr]|uniref:Uncharacterized protein n=1 Tax=Cochliobolus sativus (strain ND90Pr / ATCC 201652) TaxID=665912 RepID=M2RUP9_COCSN|nr:uncharacterized protein COCSADRAFT_348244 [Bipolaris sorokiniana ND90Pr]EMD58858.1 hypothetical protein COCSADRAFT_348244 [Bipolaris sorokiniana ND90Pr]
MSLCMMSSCPRTLGRFRAFANIGIERRGHVSSASSYDQGTKPLLRFPFLSHTGTVGLSLHRRCTGNFENQRQRTNGRVPFLARYGNRPSLHLLMPDWLAVLSLLVPALPWGAEECHGCGEVGLCATVEMQGEMDSGVVALDRQDRTVYQDTWMELRQFRRGGRGMRCITCSINESQPKHPKINMSGGRVREMPSRISMTKLKIRVMEILSRFPLVYMPLSNRPPVADYSSQPSVPSLPQFDA